MDITCFLRALAGVLRHGVPLWHPNRQQLGYWSQLQREVTKNLLSIQPEPNLLPFISHTCTHPHRAIYHSGRLSSPESWGPLSLWHTEQVFVVALTHGSPYHSPPSFRSLIVVIVTIVASLHIVWDRVTLLMWIINGSILMWIYQNWNSKKTKVIMWQSRFHSKFIKKGWHYTI